MYTNMWAGTCFEWVNVLGRDLTWCNNMNYVITYHIIILHTRILEQCEKNVFLNDKNDRILYVEGV